MLVGMKVKIYKNLHNGILSIVGKNAEGLERVIGHCERITLSDAVFKVSEKGRQRVLKRQKKNMHAVIEGLVIEIDGLKLHGPSFTYNPYTDQSFIDRHSGMPIFKASLVQIDCRGNHYYKA